MPKTIVIADDHAFTASGMGAALGAMAGFQVVATAANGIEAIAMIRKHRPACAVLDLSMPGANGLEVFLEARRWSPETRIAIVTGNTQPAIFAQLVEAGVEGIFLKNSPPEKICASLSRIAAGARVIAPEVSSLMGEAGQGEDLTAREIEVLHGIARGQSNREIAEVLGLSPKTVDSHRTSLMRKMAVNSTASLLVAAMRRGLIDV